MKHIHVRLFNTLGREKQQFEPIDRDNIRVYYCGPTVYDIPHIGNIRAALVADTLNRTLRAVYGHDKVTFAMNLTDIDDRIIDKANCAGVEISEITEPVIARIREIREILNIVPPDIEPRATEHIPHIISMIGAMVAKGIAYVIDGHVYFSVDKTPFHGLLSGQDNTTRLAGARVELSSVKENQADFVLWKPSTGSQPGWHSPWGYGRPGWHIECSAMIAHHLGKTIDIHGGGADLIFPHHENERTQSEFVHGEELANYWIHNGMVLADGKKMSKSLGNFVTTDEILSRAHGETIRLVMLGSHYRKPLDWSWERLADAKAIMDKFYRALQRAWPHEYYGKVHEYPARVVEKLADDLNTPDAIQAIHMMAENALNSFNGKELGRLRTNLIGAGNLLGILQLTPDEWFHQGFTTEQISSINDLIVHRHDARIEKKWDVADSIRNTLTAMGVFLEDTPHGTIWRNVG